QRAYPHLSPGLGWTGKAQKLKRSRPFRPGRVLGRSWQTCAEAGSHPVKNSVISNSCEGFGGRDPRPIHRCVRQWPECCTFFGQIRRAELTVRTITGPDNG